MVHEDNLLSKKSKVEWTDLMDEKFIMLREGFTVYDMVMSETNRAGFEPDIICETSQWKFILELVSYNMGIAVLPQSALAGIEIRQSEVQILPLAGPEVHWEIGIGWPKNSYVSLATQKWIGFLEEKLKV